LDWQWQSEDPVYILIKKKPDGALRLSVEGEELWKLILERLACPCTNPEQLSVALYRNAS